MTEKPHNPYWDIVKGYAYPATLGIEGGMEIGGVGRAYAQSDPFIVDSDITFEHWNYFSFRRYCVTRFSWTVTDPDTVKFVAEHSQGKLLDAMAGTGYWAYVLRQLGVDVISSDVDPAQKGRETNNYHRDTDPFVRVTKVPAEVAVLLTEPSRTLMLSWPPMDDGAHKALKTYKGDRLIYIGEGMGGCTADDGFHDELEKSWKEVDYCRPVQWFGLHDLVTVFERIPASPGT